LLEELTGRPFKKVPPIVCNDCDRKVLKASVSSPRPFPPLQSDQTCFNSLDAVCLGFLTAGGCKATCPRHGFPCWGCRGPSRLVMSKISEGDSYEEVVTVNLAKRWKMTEDQVKPFVKLLWKQTHGLLRFSDFDAAVSRVR
jgi:coenzyme F420-reducing hydrogenase gamma subunit